MKYITYWNPPHYRQMTFEELLMGVNNIEDLRVGDHTSTRTVEREQVPKKLIQLRNHQELATSLKYYMNRNEGLLAEIDAGTLKDHYKTFYIRKKSYQARRAGQSYEEWHDKNYRRIDAPDDVLSAALTELKNILSSSMIATYHSNAYAYIENRSTIAALQRHQQWESRWFAKFDFHGFFPSTTPEFVYNRLNDIYPFCLLPNVTVGGDNAWEMLKKVLQLCFLNGGLPQGTPISPFLTNVMMIPFDYKMANSLHKFKFSNGKEDRLIYTRYADDIHISCRVNFNYKDIEKFIIDTLSDMGAPFYLNEAKTHYGNRAGSNFMLGLCLNAENNITPGHQRMKFFKADVNNYLLDKKNGQPWPVEEVYRLSGNYSYLKGVYEKGLKNKNERTYVEYVCRKLGEKYGMDFFKCLKEDLHP